MSRRRALEEHVKHLTELGEIMRSMKNLARMEQSKIGRLAAAQTQLIESIEQVAADFLRFHAESLAQTADSPRVVLLVGSQRGFCGDFNEVVLETFHQTEPEGANPAELIVLGDRLHQRVRERSMDVMGLDGPNVSEEIGAVLSTLLNALSGLQTRLGSIEFSVVHHSAQQAKVVRTTLLPPFRDGPPNDGAFTTPPVLNLPPAQFWSELVDQYLFPKLHEMFFTSLMVENQRRVTHLTGAVKHLDDKTEELGRKSRALRLEEITEEIEVILLGVDIERPRPDRV